MTNRVGNNKKKRKRSITTTTAGGSAASAHEIGNGTATAATLNDSVSSAVVPNDELVTPSTTSPPPTATTTTTPSSCESDIKRQQQNQRFGNNPFLLLHRRSATAFHRRHHLEDDVEDYDHTRDEEDDDDDVLPLVLQFLQFSNFRTMQQQQQQKSMSQATSDRQNQHRQVGDDKVGMSKQGQQPEGKDEEEADDDDDERKNQRQEQQLADTISSIISYYQNETSIPEQQQDHKQQKLDYHRSSRRRCLLTRRDVANTLLPWAIGNLIRYARGNVASSVASNNNNRKVDEQEVVAAVAASLQEEDDDQEEQETVHPQVPTAPSTSITATSLQALVFCLETWSSSLSSSSTTKAATTTDVNAIMSVCSLTALDAGAANCLSQSNLNKLVPWMMRLTLTNNDHHQRQQKVNTNQITHATISNAALKAYCLFVDHYYRPPLDMACSNLLPVLSNVVVATTSSHATVAGLHSNYVATASRHILLPVISATFRLFSHLLDAGNPKKNFTLLATAKSSLSLARIYALLQSNDTTLPHDENDAPPPLFLQQQQHGGTDNDDCNFHMAHHMFRQVLQKAWFQSSQHIDGFRSMNRPVMASRTDANQPNTAQQQQDDDLVSSTADSHSKSFRCYQEDLLDSIQALFLASSSSSSGFHDVVDTTGSHCHDQIHVLQLLPLLLDIFIEQSKQYWQQPHGGGSGFGRKHANNTNSSSSSELSALQFRFWGLLTAPIMDLVSNVSVGDILNEEKYDVSGIQLACLRSMRQGLQLVVEHQMYRPSQHDHVELLDQQQQQQQQQDQQLKSKRKHPKEKRNQPNLTHHTQCVVLLHRVTQFLLMAGAGDEAIASRSHVLKKSEEHCSETIQALHLVLQLNHNLLHSRLGQIIALAAPWHQGASTKQFVSAIARTYSRLRQLDHLVSSFLVAAGVIGGDNDRGTPDGRLVVTQLVQEVPVACEIARAMESCPIEQVRIVFDTLNQEIVDSTKHQEDTTAGVVVSASVQLLVRLFGNVRVDSYTASKVVELCRHVMDGAVATLLRNSRTTSNVGGDLPLPSSRTKQGLILCGWAMDLHIRCSFWLDQDSSTIKTCEVVSSSLSFKVALSLLDLAVTSHEERQAVPPVAQDSFSDEIHFFAGYRIRQLHSLIYESQRVENSDDARSSEQATALVKEAQLLTGFVIGLAQRETAVDTKSKSLKWTKVAQWLPYWSHYAGTTHIRAFLKWLFLALTWSSAANRLDSNQGDETSFMLEEKEAAKALVGDASFYELTPIARELHAVGLACFVEVVQLALQEVDIQAKTRFIVEGIDLVSILKSQQPEICDVETLSMLLRQGRSHRRDLLVAGNGTKLRNALARAVTIIDLVQKLPTTSLWHECANNIITRLLIVDVALDIMLNNIQGDNDNVSSSLLRLESVLRSLLSRYFDRFGDNRGLVTDSVVLSSLVTGLFQSMIRLSHSERCMDLLKASGSLIRTVLARNCFRNEQGQRVAGLQSVMEKVTIPLQQFKNESNSLNCVVLARYVVSGLSKTLAPLKSPGGCDVVAIISEMKSKLWPIAMESIENVGPASPECLILVAEFYRALPVQNDGDDDAKSLKVSVLAAIKHLKDPSDETIQRAALYLAASFNPKLLDVELWMSLLEHVVVSRHQECLCEAAFAVLVREASEGQVQRVLERFLGRNSDVALSARSKIRYAQLLITNLDEELHQELLGQARHDLFFRDLALLYPVTDDQESWSEDVVAAMSSLVELCKARDFGLFKERELAQVLSRICAVLTSYQNDGRLIQVPRKVYEASYKLLMLLLQRFPKQLANCVPCVVSVFRVMQRQAIAGPQTGSEVFDKGQKYGRLCEILVPQKDVYKKHVLGLLIDFIDALKGNLHPHCKKVLLPAVFCLLDLLSQYETEQLNALIDETGKALFRSVYQDYQSKHVYKGQY